MEQIMENHSAWVLCPSKKFPGRYYYFNTQTGENAWTWTVPSGQTQDGRTAENPKQRRTPDGRAVENTRQTQTPDGRTAEKTQSSFGKVEFPKYLHKKAINLRKNCALKKSNFNKPNAPVNNPNLTSGSRKSEHLQFKSILNNPFSLRHSESLKTDSKQLCEESHSRISVFEPLFDDNFLPKRRSSIDIDELGQAMKKARICSPSSSISEKDNFEWNPDKVKTLVEFDDDSSSSTTRNRWHRNEDVKVCINFLRNLSKSEYTDAWYLVPDVEVLLENLNFIKEFIAGDRTCSLLTPAIVLAKLQSLRDDYRTPNAGQVYLWLVENSVCETNNHLDCSLDNVTVHKQIIEYCIQANTFHLVIITKSKSLWDQARRKDIHVYYLNALKIINPKENLFLLDPDSAETFKWPTSPTVPKECNSTKSAYENFEICVNQSGERSFILFSSTSDEKENSMNVFEGNVKKNDVSTSAQINFEGHSVESNLREFCTKHANLQANVDKIVDECTCSFLQIMEYCLHNILQRLPETQFDPPYWLYEGLRFLKERYYQNKVLCEIVDRLISMCGFYVSNDILRPNIKSDQFIQILGAGSLLVKELEKISQFPELSESKEMLTHLIESIQTSEEFPEELYISLKRRRRIGDLTFRMERDETAENTSCDRFVSRTERTSQHEVITNTEPDYNISLLQQNQHNFFDVEGCSGSIKLFRNDVVDGNNSNQDKTIQSTASNQHNTIQSTGSTQDKIVQSAGSNQYKTLQLTGSNEFKTIQSICSNQYKAIQSTGSTQGKTIQSICSNQNKAIQSTGSTQGKTIQSTGFNQYKTIQSSGSNQDEISQSIPCNQNKSDVILQHNQDMLISSNVVSYESGSSNIQNEDIRTNGISQRNDNGDPVFQKLENMVDTMRIALTRMKRFIEVVMEELNKGEIPERRKERLRETNDRFIDCTTGILKRENPNDPNFGKTFAVQNPLYTECIERCLEQFEYTRIAFGYISEALK
ncbi:uncharacterized protein LOC123875431 isoform X2 [Maniola jurtina]|uniref:uncharacterized protein LOC123875431 isoform X2 n=1 Tax=Maniola jurtina TaxID=191418 RepID=UPI001E689726|nr:uncharacterized protein LOC123875431 isoform X2 [Maniola jurtina]